MGRVTSVHTDPAHKPLIHNHGQSVHVRRTNTHDCPAARGLFLSDPLVRAANVIPFPAQPAPPTNPPTPTLVHHPPPPPASLKTPPGIALCVAKLIKLASSRRFGSEGVPDRFFSHLARSFSYRHPAHRAASQICRVQLASFPSQSVTAKCSVRTYVDRTAPRRGSSHMIRTEPINPIRSHLSLFFSFYRFSKHPPATCSRCLCLHIDHHVTSNTNTTNVTEVPCPAAGCGAVMEYEDVHRLSSPTTFLLYDRHLLTAALSSVPNFRWCKVAGCGNGQDHDEGHDKPIVKCGKCGGMACFTHDVAWHTYVGVFGMVESKWYVDSSPSLKLPFPTIISPSPHPIPHCTPIPPIPPYPYIPPTYPLLPYSPTPLLPYSQASRPTISVYSASDASSAGTVVTPAVFRAPIRPDIVQFVHTNMAKNKRQPYAVSREAGHQTSAISWGTGRAVARIPRVSGGGTHRAGQAAYGNMCRGGRMFAPTKTWRKWHVKTNQNQKRFAVASALAASALPALVMARGHKIDKVAEVPLVLDGSVESLKKTKDAVTALKAANAAQDVKRVVESKKLRAGKGKLRNRRHKSRRGPLVVYDKDDGIVQAFRNIPGVEVASVHSLSLLQLAPGGHVGRFIVWTQPAVEKLDRIFGTTSTPSEVKKEYTLPFPTMTLPDLPRLINSDEVQSVLKPAQASSTKRPHVQRKNPLKNVGVLVRLNPYALVTRRKEMLAEKKRAEDKEARKSAVEAKKAAKKVRGGDGGCVVWTVELIRPNLVSPFPHRPTRTNPRSSFPSSPSKRTGELEGRGAGAV
ncbi:hypothetical protein HDU93_008857 [Gonapodya sp. JEL0774]|nr:hypothetical protein HDU93_008857 [Gonapodya sp. JEL0774]